MGNGNEGHRVRRGHGKHQQRREQAADAEAGHCRHSAGEDRSRSDDERRFEDESCSAESDRLREGTLLVLLALPIRGQATRLVSVEPGDHQQEQ